MGTKVSELSQVSNVASTDLMLVTQDEGSSYLSKSITYGAVKDEIIQDNLNIVVSAWRIIRGLGTSFNLMIKGFVDGFKDELGIDTGASTNQSYDASGDLYKPSSTPGQAGGFDIIDPIPIAYWKMNDTGATTTVIESMNGFNGTAQNTCDNLTVAGAGANTGTALSFNGSSDFVLTTFLDIPTRFTVAAWVKTAYSGSYQSICSNVAPGGGGVQFLIDPSGYVYSDLSSDGNSVSSTDIINDNNWHLIILVFDQGVQYSIYIDGVNKTGANSFVNPSVNRRESSWDIGHHKDGYFLTGSIDDVRIYNIPLTPSQISAIYNQGAGSESFGKVAHYRMNDNLATTDVIDSVGGNTGTLNGGSTTADKSVAGVSAETGGSHGALSFNGSTDYVSITDCPLLNAVTQFSFSLWVNDAGIGGAPQWICKYISDSNYINLFSAGTVIYGVVSNNTPTGYGYTASGTLELNKWQHVVMVYNGNGASNSDKLKIYVNNVLRPLGFDGTISSSTPDLTGYPLQFGIRNSSSLPLTGSLDDIRIYSYALASAEIEALYNETKGTEYDSAGLPLAHYKMNDNAATQVVIDSVGGNNGTSVRNTSLMHNDSGNPPNLGGCLTFNGSSDFVDTYYQEDFGTGDFSIALWMYPTNFNDHYNAIISNSVYGGTWDGLNMSGSDNLGGLNFSVAGIDIVTPSGTIIDNSWYHLAMVRNNGIVNGYINGALVVSGSAPGTVTVARSILIGLNQDGTYPRPFTGSLDDIRIYGRALTANEVQSIYNVGLGTEDDGISNGLSPIGLVAHYKMNDNKADKVVIDNTGNAMGTSGYNDTEDMSVAGVSASTGTALSFGSGDYIDASDSYLPAGASPCSIFCWVNVVNNSAYHSILAYGSGVSTTVRYFCVANDGTLYFSDGNTPARGVANVATGTWKHIGLIYDGNATQFYVDGVPDGTPTANIFATVLGSLKMGVWFEGGNLMLGSVDDIRIYNRALTPAEIAILYASGSGTERESSRGVSSPATTNNMTLISNGYTAQTTPNTARITLFEQDVDTIALNTDLIASVSRDGGTTYTPATLVEQGNVASSTRLLSAVVDVSGQPSGVSIKTKVETKNQKNLNLLGESVLWT